MFNIALNTFRELIRNRFTTFIVVLAGLFLLASFSLETLALGEIKRVLYDFGLSFMELTGFLVILFLGGGMLYREIEGRTIYLMLSKPIDRASIVFGKFFGFASILVLMLGLQLALLVGILMFRGIPIDPVLFIATLGIYLKLLCMLGIILFFSTFTSPLIATFATFAIYIIAHNSYVVLEHAFDHASNTLKYFAYALLSFLPNLDALNTKIIAGTGAHLNTRATTLAYLLALAYIVVILLLSGVIFRKKTFDAN